MVGINDIIDKFIVQTEPIRASSELNTEWQFSSANSPHVIIAFEKRMFYGLVEEKS